MFYGDELKLFSASDEHPYQLGSWKAVREVPGDCNDCMLFLIEDAKDFLHLQKPFVKNSLSNICRTNQKKYLEGQNRRAKTRKGKK